MTKLLSTIAAICVGVLTVPAMAADQDDVMATVNQFVDGFNKGDVESAIDACAHGAIIIDEFAPHVWQGPKACAAWANDFDADAKKNGITDAIVTLKAPKHVDISGDRAYVVVPVDYNYKQ